MPYKDGVYEEPTNEDRAGWALTALEAFAGETRNTSDIYLPEEGEEGGAEVLEEVATDLICDLMHLLKKYGADPEAVISRGRGHFEYEEDEEEGDALIESAGEITPEAIIKEDEDDQT